MPSVDVYNPNSLILFDDWLLEYDYVIKDYFVRGRHKNITCIHLSQCYLIMTSVTRNNLNMLVIFKQTKHHMKFKYNDFVGSGML